MTTEQLKAIAKQEPKKQQTALDLMLDPKIKAQIALALPKDMTADRMARIVMTEIRKTPKLLQCNKESFLGAVMQCSQLGLEPGSALGHAYLLPYGNNVQLIIGYRGMIDIARRSGQILSIEARVVYETDRCEVACGLDSNLVHVRDFEAEDRGQLKFVYAVAKLKDGGKQFEVMGRKEVDKVRKMSKSGESGPWKDNYEEMAKKTVIRRLFKYLPVSIEVAKASAIDDAAETDKGQNNADYYNAAMDGMTIDADTGEIFEGGQQ